MAETEEPLMEVNARTRNTTVQFLRSFSIISDDSDFDELDEPDTPGYFLDGGGDHTDGHVVDTIVHHTRSMGICLESGATKQPADLQDSKIIPFTNVHKPRKGFTNVRPDCWMNEKIQVNITDIHREDHPHMTRKAFNPNLYNIEITHGEYKWTVRRRYKHFDSLHKALRLFRARYSMPVPTKKHREMRQSIKEDRKERKIKKKQTKKISKFPKRPEWMVKEEHLKKRGEHLEQYLQSILESKWYRNHTELLKFLDVSELSFINRLGLKWKEGDVNKCSGGRRISIGCCGCLKKYHVAGRWSNRWLVVKDTFVAYTRPSDGVVCDVMLMDSDFKVESGMSATGAVHGLLVTNLSRVLLAKCWTSRKADEWEEGIQEAIKTTGQDFTNENRYGSYAPVRENSYARWFVDGSSYFEAVADALEKAREEIFITDWWLSPEIYLKRHVTDREKWRLDEILARKAKAGVKVFVLLYKELEIALTINSQYSKDTLRNKCPENIKVIRHPDHVAGGNRVLLWAHHEKMVVIDQKTAFTGGLDLCYGRWDDELHRMTDLGSVTNYNTTQHKADDTANTISTPLPVNGAVHNKYRGAHSYKKHKAHASIPSPIIESRESLDVEEPEENKEDPNDGVEMRNSKNSSIQTGAQSVHKSADNVNTIGREDSERDNDNARHSLNSEKDFGSSDILTDNDSLENVDKIGYTNVVADVTVHVADRQNSADTNNYLSQNGDSSAKGANNKQGSNNDLSNKCNKSSVNDSKGHKNETNHSNRDLDTENGTAGNIDNGVLKNRNEDTVNADDVLFDGYIKENSVDLETIEKQIITEDNLAGDKGGAENIPETETCSNVINNKESHEDVCDSVTMVTMENTAQLQGQPKGQGQTNLETDLNKNHHAKGSVRFREGLEGEIREDKIVPTQAVLIEGSPKGKKDAATKRETWASRKIRKTFGFHGAKYEEDETDGAKSDKEKSDSDDESGGKFKSKWRMVLNIKKLEHAGKQSDDEDKLGPVSPHSRGGHSPRQPLRMRIRQSMPFRTQRQDSDEDMYFNLYPWKKGLLQRVQRNEGSVQVKSVMKTSVADDYEGLEGSSKLWIGKDYVNFIHKDPVDVHNPFEDFIERDKTPRMPWHDIGSVVYGKAARDVARHFIRRWNFCKTEKFKKKKEYPLLMPKSYNKCEVSQSIKDITYQVNSQVLRSSCGWSAGINRIEKSIHTAYIDCIRKAKHYIYIENQFFISQVGDHTAVKNEIAEALLARIERAYKEKETFRVYIVLPLLPAFEGEIGANGGYAIQAVLHWNYKSISKGPHSLWQQLLLRVDDPKKYLLFCGLRTHTELTGKLVTELVYVHSKLMIVDDDTVIIGSANINDRSLVGNRDSELATLVEDTQKFPVTMDGKDHMAGPFASSLRRTLFREHLGIPEGDTSIDLTDPICDNFYKNIWYFQASVNTTIYHKVFNCIPDDHVKTFAQIKVMSSTPPMADTDPTTAKQELLKVKGRLVLMPLVFLEHEESILAAGMNKEGLMPDKLWT